MKKIPAEHRLIALKAYLRYIRPFRRRILFVVALFTIANILLVVIPVFIGLLIQALTQPPVDTVLAWKYAWILVGLSTAHDIFWRGSEFAYRGLLNEMTYRYETQLFQSVITKPYPYFVDKMTGKIGSYITTISKEFRNLLGNVLFDGTGQFISLVAAAAILGSLNWQTGFIFMVGLIGMFAVGRYTLRYNMRLEAKAMDKDSSKNGILYDAIANYASVKALHTDYQEVQTIDSEQTKTIHANQKAFLSGIIFWASMSIFVRHLMWPAIVLMNVWFFLHGQLSVGQLATLLSTVLMFSSTIWSSIWYISQLGQQMARVDEAHLYLFGPTTDIFETATKDAEPIEFRTSLQICDLTFAYPDKPDNDVVRNISIDIPYGQKIGIVGRSGGGKSTLTKLLLGLYPTSDGTFKVDGTPTTNSAVSKLVSFVPQDTALFHRSIADNIAYGTAQTTGREAITRAAKQAYAHEFVKTLPKQYDTLIGERGVKLSGGQRQRISIARAILQDKPILVLDEATSALDSESEILVQKALNVLWRDKTVIAIAHRLSTLRHMDRILVMDDGKIIEDGTHMELIEKNGVYAKLWKHQSGGFIET